MRSVSNASAADVNKSIGATSSVQAQVNEITPEHSVEHCKAIWPGGDSNFGDIVSLLIYGIIGHIAAANKSASDRPSSSTQINC